MLISLAFVFSTSISWADPLADSAQLDKANAVFELRDGDRVVLLGGTFIERMQSYGYLETLLTAAYPDRNITFRNLGWSGDTVWGESRALFGSQADGFARLVKDTKDAEPTVLFICYGANEAHAGQAGLPRFVEGLKKLLVALADTRARVVLLSPHAYEAGHATLPDPASYNTDLQAYCDAIEETAARRQARYVSLFDLLDAPGPWTDNGVHLTEAGYRHVAPQIVRRLQLKLENPAVLDAPLNTALCDAIRRKNELYFHRYRPQNETYLFLFRKHEQGNNAVEIPQFDPLIAQLEIQIAALRKPR